MKKTIILLVFSIILATNYCTAQTPNWLWAKSAGGAGVDESTRITTDALGNIIITGDFGGQTCNFDNTVLTNNGYLNGMRVDYFIAKYTSSGNLIWAKSAGGSHNDNIWGVTTDSHGNIYICGGFNSPSLTIGATTLINKGDYDIFIAKYDSSGNVIWAKGFGSASLDNAFDIKCDRNDNLYFTGEFTFDSISFDGITLMNAGWEDVFIVKCDTMGNVIWAKHAGSDHTDIGLSIATANNGDIYLSGQFISDTLSFDNNVVIKDTVLNYDYTSVFIVKFDSLGNSLWAKSFGGGLGDAGYVATDDSGNVYISGAFWNNTINIGGIVLANGHSSQGADIYLAKFDLSGNVVWAKKASGAINDATLSIASDGKGSIYISGFSNSNYLDFDGTILNNSGGFDIFLAKYDFAGNFIFAKNIGGSRDESVSAVCTDNAGNLYLNGQFYSTSISLDNIILSNHPINSDVFIARLGNPAGIDESNNSSGISLFPNPSTDNITLIIPEKAIIEFLNIEGQKVKSMNANESITNIDISGFAKGMYFIKVKTDNGVTIKKFIKE